MAFAADTPPFDFILSHAGGFVSYASHRMAVAILGETGCSPLDTLQDFSSFYFDTALSSSAAALPTLLAFADPGHLVYGSDWPFAPVVAAQYFAAGLETYGGIDQWTLESINRTDALALLPRLGAAPTPVPSGLRDRVRTEMRRRAVRLVSRAVSTK